MSGNSPLAHGSVAGYYLRAYNLTLTTGAKIMEPDEKRNLNTPPPVPLDDTGTPISPHHPNTPIGLPFVDSIRALAGQLGDPCGDGSGMLSEEDRERLDAIQRDYAAGVLRLLGAAYSQAAVIFERKAD